MHNHHRIDVQGDRTLHEMLLIFAGLNEKIVFYLLCHVMKCRQIGRYRRLRTVCYWWRCLKCWSWNNLILHVDVVTSVLAPNNSLLEWDYMYCYMNLNVASKYSHWNRWILSCSISVVASMKVLLNYIEFEASFNPKHNSPEKKSYW